MLIDIIRNARDEGRSALLESEAKALLAERGVRVPPGRMADSAEAAVAAAEEIGYPVAMKVASPDVLHKSDVGGVRLGLREAGEVARAYGEVLAGVRARQPGARLGGVLVERMVAAGQEVIVGLTRDAVFGPVVMVGLGGVFVEVLGDVAFRVAPIGRADAEAMLGELRGAALLAGARGRAAVDRGALVELLLAVAGPGGLGLDERVGELDLNPVIAGPDGAVVADARLVLRSRPPRPLGEGQGEGTGPLALWERAGDEGSVEQRASSVIAALTPTRSQGARGKDADDLMRVVFEPRSIAVIGASTDPLALGQRAVRHLVDFGYSGGLYPIHPRAEEIAGVKAYPSLSAAPERAERAIVTVRAERVPAVIAECAAAGVRVAHVYTGGFGELDEAGRRLEGELLALAAGSGPRIIGPNSIGTYCPAGGLTPTAGTTREAGAVAFVSQSGGLTFDVIRRGAFQGLRFSKAISIGNAIDLEAVDFLEHFVADPATRVIGGYLESVRDGARLRRVLERAAGRKPVVILKGGQTRSGQRAAASHTGALASDFAVWRGLFRQTGVAGVRSLEELIEALLAFQMLEPPAGPGVALVGPGGGASVTATDAAERQGLAVAPFGAETVAALRALELPPGTSLVNPLDVPASVLRVREGAVLGEVLRRAAGDPAVHALVVHLNLVAILALAPLEVTAGLVANMVAAVLAVKAETDRPVCLVLRSSGEPEQEAVVGAERTRALAAGIPVYAGLEETLRALGHLYRWGRFQAGRSVAGAAR